MSQVWVLISAIVAISLSSVASFGFDFDGGVTIDLYHALDAQDVEYFTPRGNINIDLSRGGTNMPSVVQSPLKGVERDQLKVLAEQDAFYRLKAIVRYNDGSNATFLTFSKAVGQHSIFQTIFLHHGLMIVFSVLWPGLN